MEKRSSPPKKLKIKGQPHKLAYINDVEEGLLRARGGSGEMVHGIPAFYSDDDDAFDGASMQSFQDDYGGGGGGDEYEKTANLADLMAGAAARNRINAQNAATIAAAQNKPKVRQVYDDTNYGAATKAQLDALGRSYLNSIGTNGRNIFAPSIYSSKRVGGSWSDFFKGGGTKSLMGVPLYSSWMDFKPTREALATAAVQQLKDSGRFENAANNYGTPSFAGAAMGALGTSNLNNIVSELEDGGRAAVDEFGNVQGSFNTGLFGIGEHYTGNAIEGLEETGYQADPYNDGNPTPIENPLTGEKECPEGYFFDEDLQSCRMGSATAAAPAAPVTAPATGAYYRPTGLETASAFTPAGFDYNAANSAFLDSYAYRPENYQDPMSLNGFKQII
jgi:hypothetical protein